MANFMGQRLGTINGHPYIANRVKTPMFPSARVMPKSNHRRFLIRTTAGQFWSPFVRHQRLISTIPKCGTVVELECDPLLSDHSFPVHNILVVDLENQIIGQPFNFSLPYEVLGHEIHVFKWQIYEETVSR